jgi:hypothetical protein
VQSLAPSFVLGITPRLIERAPRLLAIASRGDA